MNSNDVIEAEIVHHYQVIQGYGLGGLRTRLSFWAADDAEAKRIAGMIPLGCVLVRMVEP